MMINRIGRRIKQQLILACLLIMSILLTACSSLQTGFSGTSDQVSIPDQPDRIVLLLPLSGPLAADAQAIRNGFFAAYYQDRQQRETTPTIRVVDSYHQNIITLYQQAVTGGADLVVGPLTKENVTRLARSGRITVPTLALNEVSGLGPVHNLYQFGLSPSDETQQAAMRAWADGRRQVLVIAPNSAWGHANANVFINQWRHYGGIVSDQVYYTNQASLDGSVRQLLQVNTDLLRDKTVPDDQKRRQDVDMVFMIADPKVARQIKPLLNYYFAADLPVYATSHVYQGTPHAKQDRDLDGVMFSDIPWVLMPQQMQPRDLNDLHRSLAQMWPSSFAAHPRLYALGVDAYDLLAQLHNMQAIPNYNVDSATGTLQLNAQQHVVRQLYWAQFSRGIPRPI